jgi:beta-lactamase superfamily II metal-dependent hydrolase
MGFLHHLKVGCADCSVIVSGNNHFLIDTHNIEDYKHLLPDNKTIHAVFITHQHYDHFDGLRFLKDNEYKINYLIYSPYDRRRGDNSVDIDEWNECEELIGFFKGKGSKTYSPYRQTSFDKPWWTTNGIDFWMIGPPEDIAKSETRELHDASLIIHAKMGSRRCLFTGDASDTALEFVAVHTNNICNDILHASHHGSINGASLEFIKKCNCNYTVISTESGQHENVPHPTALKRYKDNTKETVYRTDTDGSIKWTF